MPTSPPSWSTFNALIRKRIQAKPNSSHAVDRKVTALLNKLTMETFDSISDQIIAYANKSEKERDGRTLIQVIRLVFEKATDEPLWSELYAKLCRKMMEQISPKVQDEGIRNHEGKPVGGGLLFRKYLLNRCQEDFESGWKVKEATAKVTASELEDEAEVALYSDKYYAAQKTKRQGLGLIKFIGELFKLQMLTERIMHECVKKLLGNVNDPAQEEIESLCMLLTTVGHTLDTRKARAHMDVYFARIKELTKSPHLNLRLQFTLQDTIELRERDWKSRQSSVILAGHPITFVNNDGLDPLQPSKQHLLQSHFKHVDRKTTEAAFSADESNAKEENVPLDGKTSIELQAFSHTQHARRISYHRPDVSVITDMNSIRYPGGVSKPSTELNFNPTRFQYDRNFLLQFMPVCTGRPDQFPVLAEVGLGEIDPGLPRAPDLTKRQRKEAMRLQSLAGSAQTQDGKDTLEFSKNASGDGADPDVPHITKASGVKDLLGRVSTTTIDPTADRIIVWVEISHKGKKARLAVLQQALNAIVEEAVNHPTQSTIYARLYSRVMEKASRGLREPMKRLILEKCQESFQQELIELVDQAGDQSPASSSRPRTRDVPQDLVQPTKRLVGISILVQELYAMQLLTEKAVVECVGRLFLVLDPELLPLQEGVIESLCILLKTLESQLKLMDAGRFWKKTVYMKKLKTIAEDTNATANIQTMLQVSVNATDSLSLSGAKRTRQNVIHSHEPHWRLGTRVEGIAGGADHMRFTDGRE